jgi:hypothetical protein
MIEVFVAGMRNINRTYPGFIDELARRSNDFLRVSDVNALDLDIVRRRLGRAHLIVLDNSVYMALINRSTSGSPSLRGALVKRLQSQSHYKAIIEAIFNATCPKLFVASGWDLHWRADYLDQLKASFDGIAWMFDKPPISFSDVPDKYKDSWMNPSSGIASTGFRIHDPLEVWREITRSFKVSIELPHALGEDEFSLGSFEHRHWDVAIPGVSYATRVIGARALVAEGIPPAPFLARDSRVTRWATWAIPFVGGELASRWWISSRVNAQQRLLRQTKVACTCGSGVMYGVRKFYEIPAAGCVLVSYADQYLENLGFVDGKTFIYATPESYGKTVVDLLRRPKACESIRTAGFKMVKELHSMRKRVDDFVECLHRMKSHSLSHASFVSGQFQIR